MSWTTIESDAGVFTDLIENLGVSGVEVEELYTLDEETLRNISDIYGIIFLFKWKKPDGKPDGELDYESIDRIFFGQQVINNACATQALLSVLLNHSEEINLGPKLNEFREFTKLLPPDLKGEALGNSDDIRCAHNSFARSDPFVSDETKVATEDDDVYHFIAYTNINNTFYELDGLQPAPINHGSCTKEEFSKRAVTTIQSRIGKYDPSEIRFNLMAISKDKRLTISNNSNLSEEEKVFYIAAENDKRAKWKRENQLRRHNFLGLIVEMSKLMAKDRIAQNTWDTTLEEAKKMYSMEK